MLVRPRWSCEVARQLARGLTALAGAPKPARVRPDVAKELASVGLRNETRATPRDVEEQRFIDRMRTRIKAGDGGPGAVSFRREKRVPEGGPDGGDGGRGGSVIVTSTSSLQTLSGVSSMYRAESGRPGGGRNCSGRSGKDIVIQVPTGTVVSELLKGPPAVLRSELVEEAGEAARVRYPGPEEVDGGEYGLFPEAGEPEVEIEAGWLEAAGLRRAATSGRLASFYRRTLADLDADGASFLLARGGRGGKGNAHFATARLQAPKFAQPGEPGESRHVELELKSIADVGLVGYPNAGKSTLLTAVSRARPKVAAYPFTTLHVHVGCVEFEDELRMLVADIPGLVDGAHRNVGLGHDFLRHVERTRVLAFVLDASAPAPWHDLAALRREVELYQPGLARRASVVVANKMDLGPRAAANARELRRRLGPDAAVVEISGMVGTGVGLLLARLRAVVQEERAKIAARTA